MILDEAGSCVGIQMLNDRTVTNVDLLALDFCRDRYDDGKVFNVEDHWEHDTTTPSTEEGQFLYNLAYDLFNAGVFNIILTPNYNSVHDDHFHMDLTPFGDFIKSPGGRYIGPNEGH